MNVQFSPVKPYNHQAKQKKPAFGVISEQESRRLLTYLNKSHRGMFSHTYPLNGVNAKVTFSTVHNGEYGTLAQGGKELKVEIPRSKKALRFDQYAELGQTIDPNQDLMYRVPVGTLTKQIDAILDGRESFKDKLLMTAQELREVILGKTV